MNEPPSWRPLKRHPQPLQAPPTASRSFTCMESAGTPSRNTVWKERARAR